MRLDLLAALSGILISLQARTNGELSLRLNNGLQAAFISFGSGLILIAIISLFNPTIKSGVRRLRAAVVAKEIAPWTLFAGALGGTFVAVQTQIVPLIGVAIYSVASIAGQGATSLIVDRIEAKDLSLIAVFFAGLAGAIVGVQRAMNGLINEHSQQSFTTSLLNFIMGTTTLGVVLLIAVAIGKVEFVALPAGPWWIYMGGVIGVIYIAFTSTIVQHLGVLTFTIFSTGGQLIGALFIDLISPTKGVSVSAYLVSGIVMTFLGVLVGGANSSKSSKR